MLIFTQHTAKVFILIIRTLYHYFSAAHSDRGDDGALPICLLILSLLPIGNSGNDIHGKINDARNRGPSEY